MHYRIKPTTKQMKDAWQIREDSLGGLPLILPHDRSRQKPDDEWNRFKSSDWSWILLGSLGRVGQWISRNQSGRLNRWNNHLNSILNSRSRIPPIQLMQLLSGILTKDQKDNRTEPNALLLFLRYFEVVWHEINMQKQLLNQNGWPSWPSWDVQVLYFWNCLAKILAGFFETFEHSWAQQQIQMSFVSIHLSNSCLGFLKIFAWCLGFFGRLWELMEPFRRWRIPLM